MGTYYVGIRPGERRRDSAGATRKTVTLDLSALPEGYRGAVSLRASGGTAVLAPRDGDGQATVWVVWHGNDAGTWHGIGRPGPHVSGWTDVIKEPGADVGHVRCSDCGVRDEVRWVPDLDVGTRLVVPEGWTTGERPNRTGLWYWHRCPTKPESPVSRSVPGSELVWYETSSSGGGDIAGLVVRLEPGTEPVCLLTSSYRGRGGWTVWTLCSDGKHRTERLADWRAARGEGVAL